MAAATPHMQDFTMLQEPVQAARGQVREFTDDGVIIPFGEWFADSLNWCKSNIGGLFDAIEWPFGTAFYVLGGEGDSVSSVPRVAVIAVLGIVGYLGGGLRRLLYVAGSLGVVAVMGSQIWSASIHEITALAVVVGAVALLSAASLLLLDRIGAETLDSNRPSSDRIFDGWSWIHPLWLMLPGLVLFGVGENMALVMTTFAVLPVALKAARCDAVNADGSGTWPGTRVHIASRAAVQPAVLLLGLFSYAGHSGLGTPDLSWAEQSRCSWRNPSNDRTLAGWIRSVEPARPVVCGPSHGRVPSRRASFPKCR